MSEHKRFTAQEMRYAADVREAWGDKDEVNNMLRQSADSIEREAAKDAEISSLRLKREKEISDAFFCGYDPEEALVAQCSTCRFFRKKHSHCTLNDSLTNAKYKCSKWEFKTNKECADEYKKSINNEVAELREENAHLRAALKPVLECKVMSAMTAEIAPGRSKYCATIIEEAQHIYNEGEAK